MCIPPGNRWSADSCITARPFPRSSAVYVFADYNLGYIWNIATDTAPTRTVTTTDGWESGLNPASFTEDNDGELYIVDVRTGSIYKLIQG
jgi:hypothetical protein